MGNFVEIQNLKSVKPAFQQPSGVWVLYNNGTVIDSSPETVLAGAYKREEMKEYQEDMLLV